jgi:hypothetical protein
VELFQMVTLAMSTERAIGELLHGLLPERRLRSNARVVRRMRDRRERSSRRLARIAGSGRRRG